jgi:hypothetical protein
MITKLLLIVVIVWITFASFRTIYNLSKIPREEMSWVRLDDEEKKNKAYSEIHKIDKELKKVVAPNDCVHFYTKDKTGVSYFLLRYLSYPTRVYWANLEDYRNVSNERLRGENRICSISVSHNDAEINNQRSIKDEFVIDGARIIKH